MTRTFSAPDLRPMPRFTFAGRGCRDPRREPRRLPESLRTRPAVAASITAATADTSPVAEALATATDRQSGTGGTATTRGDRDDHPPPPALRYGPRRGGQRTG